VTKVTATTVYTIEGNTSGASGVISNGGGVKAKSYPRTSARILGYGRPDWPLVKEKEETHVDKLWYEDDQALMKDLGVSDGTRPLDNITRAEIWVMLARMWRAMGK